MIIEQKLLDIQSRAKDIESKMNSGEVSGDELTKLSKEYSQLNEVLPLIDKYLQTQAGIRDAKEMLNDAELKSIAEEQLAELNHVLPDIERDLQIALLPRDAADDNSVIMEIRAGAKNLHCLRAICLININLMLCARGGRLKSSKKTRLHCVGTKK